MRHQYYTKNYRKLKNPESRRNTPSPAESTAMYWTVCKRGQATSEPD